MFTQRHDAQELKESLSLDDVKLLLNELGVEYIPEELNNSNQLIVNTICHNHTGGSSKLYYSPEYYSFTCFTKCSETFSIYDLVRKVYALRNVELSFPSLINWIAEKAGKNTGFTFSKEFVIQGVPKESEDLVWMNRFESSKVELSPLKTYSDNILRVFSGHMNHPEFTKDGISAQSMDTFDVKYYNKEDALVIPHRNIEGEIVGLMQRNFNEYSIVNGFKYTPTKIQGVLYNHIKSQNLYGLDKNIDNIKRLGKIVVFESEKSVMQVETMYGRENNFSVALSGKNISSYQVDVILGLGISEIIFCLDKEYEHHEDDDAERFTQVLLNRGRRFTPYIRTYTTWDTEGLLKRNESPSDRGAEVLGVLMATKKEILNRE